VQFDWKNDEGMMGSFSPHINTNALPIPINLVRKKWPALAQKENTMSIGEWSVDLAAKK
jgi:hypothetical protein